MANNQFVKRKEDFGNLIRSEIKDFQRLNRNNVQLTDAWMKRLKNEETIAKGYFENAHQKVQDDKATVTKLQKEIATRQQAIANLRDKKGQLANRVNFGRKCVAEKKLEKESVFECFEAIERAVDEAIRVLSKAEEDQTLKLQMYEERLRFTCAVSGTSIEISFTHISPLDLESVHRIVLKKQRSIFKVDICDPKIKIPKSYLDNLNKKESFKEFIIKVRLLFLSLYEM